MSATQSVFDFVRVVVDIEATDDIVSGDLLHDALQAWLDKSIYPVFDTCTVSEVAFPVSSFFPSGVIVFKGVEQRFGLF